MPFTAPSALTTASPDVETKKKTVATTKTIPKILQDMSKNFIRFIIRCPRSIYNYIFIKHIVAVTIGIYVAKLI
jgi:hypothetical protein